MPKDQINQLYLMEDGTRSQQIRIKKDMPTMPPFSCSIFTNLCCPEDRYQDEGEEEEGKSRFLWV